MKAYRYPHVVGFEETNVVGNVYYVNYLRWQGRCREMFLREEAPSVLAQIAAGLSIATVRVACEFFHELIAFDVVEIHMTLRERAGNRLLLGFDYVKLNEDAQQLVARGEQQVAFMHRSSEGLGPVPVPPELARALEPYEL